MENQLPNPTVESTVQVNINQQEDFDQGNPPTRMDAISEWFDKKSNLFTISAIHALIYLILSYIVNSIYFWALDDDGRTMFAQVMFCFGRLHAMLPINFALGALVLLAVVRWFQAYQLLLPGTNKLMRVYRTSLQFTKQDDTLWPEQRLRMLRKWNDWVILAWLLSVRVISTPLRNKYPTLDSILAAGFITKVEFDLIKAEMAAKKLKSNEYALVVFEWLVSLNEWSSNSYKVPVDYKTNFNAIQFFKKSTSNLIKFSRQSIPKLLILAATLVFYIFGISSILGHNVVEFEKDPISCTSTSAIVGAFFYPIVYIIPFFLYGIWLRYLRITTDPFGWDEGDVDVVKVFDGHILNANRFCQNPGADYAVAIDQINAQA